MSYKVVIPSAGLGTRIGTFTKYINKGLVTVGDKPAIVRVIEKFKDADEIIILTGYKGDMVKQVLSQFNFMPKIRFVDVDKYEGKGSGLGYTLKKAEKHLQCPFIFIPNDTLIGDDTINLNPAYCGNWAAYYRLKDDDSLRVEDFRTLNIADGFVSTVNAKGIINENIYIGLCGVLDYKPFWESMQDNESISIGESYALNNLQNKKAIRVNDWFDCGNLKSLKKAQAYFKNKTINVLPKEDESIWFAENHVIKFSVDKGFINDRIKRLAFLPKSLLPEIISANDFTYKYKTLLGSVVSKDLNSVNIVEMLDIFLNQLWVNKQKITDEFIGITNTFYKKKTYERVRHYFERFETQPKPNSINGVNCDEVFSLLDKVDWELLCNEPIFVNFHGDLHGENILTHNGKYYLLDWRQNFGGNYEYGDIYYDLAKIRHGLLVNHGIVDKGYFEVNENTNGNISISIFQYSNLLDAEKSMINWLNDNGFDAYKVKILTALVYLNVCGLHEYPYSKFLYHYGTLLLQEYLNER